VRRITSVNTISVQLAGFRVGQIAVPDLVGHRLQSNSSRFASCVRGVKETKLHLSSVFGEQSKVDSAPVPCST
jgi:hypothetical protein